MHKRQYLKKGQSQQFPPECIICQLTKIVTPSLVSVPLKILNNKYYQKPEKIKQSEVIKELLTPRLSSRRKIEYKEAMYQSKPDQRLKNYHDFNSILSHIKPIILQRVSKDFKQPLHFAGKAYFTVMTRHISFKSLSKGKEKRKILCAKNGSGTSTDSDQHPSPEKLKKLAKNKLSPCKQSENITIRRLTRNLSNMVRKFQDNFYMHPSLVFELMDFVPGHVLDLTKLEKQQLFKKELQCNISIIAEKKPIQRLHTIDVPSYPAENTYGLKVRGKVAQSRNINSIKDSKSYNKKLSSKKEGINSLKQNFSPNQRIQTDYDYQPIRKDIKKSSSSRKTDKYKSTPAQALSKAKSNHKKGTTSRSRLSKNL